MGRFARRRDPESSYAFALLLRRANRALQFSAAAQSSTPQQAEVLLRLLLGRPDNARKAPDPVSMTEKERIEFYVRACKASGFDVAKESISGMAVASDVSK